MDYLCKSRIGPLNLMLIAYDNENHKNGNSNDNNGKDIGNDEDEKCSI